MAYITNELLVCENCHSYCVNGDTIDGAFFAPLTRVPPDGHLAAGDNYNNPPSFYHRGCDTCANHLSGFRYRLLVLED